MKKFKTWWKQDKRYVTMTKAVLLALLPVLCCLVRCALDGKGIGDVYLPSGEWNDELFYFKQVEGMINYGYPQGYFGFNESHALKLSFAAWSPVLVFPWIIWGKLFGWNLLSPIICNIVLLSLACFLFVWLVKPTWKQCGILTFLFSLFTPFSRQMLSGMPEIICFSMVILFYGLAINYLNREKTYKLAVLFLMAAVMTLMRPYLLLLMLLPMYLWIRRAGWKGALGSGVILGVTLGAYAAIKHYLGAEYFAPLFFTDWIKAFFERGIFGGIRFTLGKLYYNGRDMLIHMTEGIRSGLASGAYFTGFLVMFCVLLWQTVTDGRKLRKMKKEQAADLEQTEIRNCFIIRVHLTFSFVAMFFALLLMYKLTEGSKHLLTFMAAGIFVVALMETKFYKKVTLLGVTFAYFYMYMAVNPYDYQVPFWEADVENQMVYWEEVFDGNLELERSGTVPNYENVVIWVLDNEKADGSLEYAAWQPLYGLPEGFGINCCTSEYVTENLASLQSQYLVALSGGGVDEQCRQAGYAELGRDKDIVLYRLEKE